MMAFTPPTFMNLRGSCTAFLASFAILSAAVFGASPAVAESAAEADYNCAQIAKQQTGFDPESTPLPQTAQSSGAQSGSGLRGAARGAIGGAVIANVTGGQGSNMSLIMLSQRRGAVQYNVVRSV